MTQHTYLILFIFFINAVLGDFLAASPSIEATSFSAYGNGASVDNSVIRLSLGSTDTGGRVIYNTPQDISNGFVTEIEYQSFDCDTGQWKGADGFTIFMGPYVDASVNTLSYGGDLAVSELSSAVVVAFYISGDPNPIEPTHVVFCGVNAYSNLTFPITSPHCTAINAPDLINIRCTNDTHIFRIQYVPPNTWQVFLDGKEIALYTNLLVSDAFKETIVHVGLSGGTGSGFMRQDITSWSFNTSFGVIPYLECFEDFENGTFRAHLGYDNLGSAPVTLPLGSVNNNVVPQSYSANFPSAFATGRTFTYPLAAISFDWDGSDISWQLTDYLVTFNSTMRNRLCPQDIKMDFQFTSPTIVPDAEVNIIVHNFANFSEISPVRVVCIMISYGTLVKRQTGVEAELQVLVTAANGTFIDEPSAEQIVAEFVSSANANRSIADPILNPNSDEGRELISSKPLNGNELPGLPLNQQQFTPINTSPNNNVPISNEPASAGQTPVKSPGLKMSIGSRCSHVLVLCPTVLSLLSMFM